MKSVFFVIYCLFGLILFQSCSSKLFYRQKPKYSENLKIADGNYDVFVKPYYKKKSTAFGYIFKVSLGAAAAYFAISNKDIINSGNIELLKSDLVLGSSGFIGTYFLSSVFFDLIKKDRIKYLKTYKLNNEWTSKINKNKKNKYRFIPNESLNSNDSIWTISDLRETNFKPSNLKDIRNYYSVFPSSACNDEIILKGSEFLGKSDLRAMIDLYAQNSNSEISKPAKVKYILLSENEKVFYDLLNEFSLDDSEVIAAYSKLIDNYFYSIDYFKRFPIANESADLVFYNIYEKLNKKDLDTLMKYSAPHINPSLKQKGELRVCLLSESLEELKKNLNLYPNVNYPCKLSDFNEKLSDISGIINKLNAASSKDKFISKSIALLTSELRAVYIRKNIADFNFNEERFKEFVSNITVESWIKDQNTGFLIDSVVYEYLDLAATESYFTGEMVFNKPDGFGVFYKAIGNSLTGNFNEDGLNGEGIERRKDKTLAKGVFKKSELNGTGEIYSGSGQILRGGFRDGKLNGLAELTLKDSSLLKGYFVDNALNGVGNRLNADSSYYIGEFYQNKFSGKGKYFWNKNTWYEGEFLDGKRSGIGKQVVNNEFVVNGKWKNDCLDEDVIITNFSDELKTNSEFRIKYFFDNCEIVSDNEEKEINIFESIKADINRKTNE